MPGIKNVLVECLQRANRRETRRVFFTGDSFPGRRRAGARLAGGCAGRGIPRRAGGFRAEAYEDGKSSGPVQLRAADNSPPRALRR